jgi:hypothetical protein
MRRSVHRSTATRRPTRGIGAAATLLLVLVLALVLAPVTALAAEPAGSPATGGDPRSPGQGPGLVGDPVFAIGLVLAIGIAALLLTLAYVRVTEQPRDPH